MKYVWRGGCWPGPRESRRRRGYGGPRDASGGIAADLANSHTAKHISSALSCANCHVNTTADGTHILAGSPHTDGSNNVDINPTYYRGTPQWNSTIGQKTCANIYCHADGNGGNPLQTPQWGGSTTCTSCHGNDATSGAPIASYKHS